MVPSSLIFLAVFVAPISYFFVISFWQVRAFKLRPDATLAQYAKVFESFSGPLLFTFMVAMAIALTTTFVAFWFAYYCRFKAGKYGYAFLFMALIALFGGYLTKIYMWKTILGEQGILNTALLWVGLIDTPISAFLFNPVAVLITLVHYTLPLAILPIFGSLRGVEDVPLEAARDIGASPRRVFLDIILPQCRVGIISAFSLSFIFSAGDYVTPLLVGGPNTSMIGLFIQNQFGNRLNSPLGSAMSFSVIAIGLIIIGLVALAFYRATRPK